MEGFVRFTRQSNRALTTAQQVEILGVAYLDFFPLTPAPGNFLTARAIITPMLRRSHEHQPHHFSETAANFKSYSG